MKILPYQGLGELLFSDNVNLILSKLATYKVIKGNKLFMGVKQLSLHVKELNLSIVFDNEVGDVVESFEVTHGKVIFDEIDLFETNYESLKNKFKILDVNLVDKDDGFELPKFGFGVYLSLKDGSYSNYLGSVIVFNRDYLNKKMPSVDDVIKYYLGGN